ncbi:hypothetical protein [Steroidobacter agaridevorans]|nr:hypothetical protein [Steroidobacter agaridevorans]
MLVDLGRDRRDPVCADRNPIVVEQHIDRVPDAWSGDPGVVLDAIVGEQHMPRLVRSEGHQRQIQLQRIEGGRAAQPEAPEVILVEQMRAR